MREGDELVGVRHSSGDDDILMVSRKGQAIRFSEQDVRAMGRDASGVQGMRCAASDEVIAVEIAADDSDLLVVTENGYGKRTRVSEYPKKGRGGMGVKTVQLTEARGHLAGARVVRDGYQVMLISTGGTVIKMPVEDVKRLGRSTQGVIVMRLREGELVSSLAPVVDSGDDEPGAAEPAELDAAARRRVSADAASRCFPFSRRSGRSNSRGIRPSGQRKPSPMAYSKQVDLLEPIDMAEHLDKVELYLGQVCASPASRRCSSTTGRTRPRSRPRARSSGSTTWSGRDRDADQAGEGQGPEPRRGDRRRPPLPRAQRDERSSSSRAARALRPRPRARPG